MDKTIERKFISAMLQLAITVELLTYLESFIKNGKVYDCDLVDSHILHNGKDIATEAEWKEGYKEAYEQYKRVIKLFNDVDVKGNELYDEIETNLATNKQGYINRLMSKFDRVITVLSETVKNNLNGGAALDDLNHYWYVFTTHIHELCYHYGVTMPTLTQTEPQQLPKELDTERARKYFARALVSGYMAITDNKYRWVDLSIRGNKAKLGYFILKVFCPTNTEKLPEKALNSYFDTSRIGSTITNLQNAKKDQRWREQIETDIFYD